MKHLLAVITSVMALMASFGSDAPSPGQLQRNITPVPPAKMAEWTKRTGGMVKQDPNGKSILIVDARKDKTLGFGPLAKTAQVMLHLPFEVREVEPRMVSNPYLEANAFKDVKHPAVMFVFDTEGLPSLSIYPENAVGCLNVHTLADGDVTVVKQRLLREFWRLTGFTLGGYAPGMGSVMQPAFSVSDLDGIRGTSLNPLQFNGILNAAIRLDLRTDREVPYSAACKMGWAPPPTNNVQKAIYERFMNRRINSADPSARWKRDFPDDKCEKK